MYIYFFKFYSFNIIFTVTGDFIRASNYIKYVVLDILMNIFELIPNNKLLRLVMSDLKILKILFRCVFVSKL